MHRILIISTNNALLTIEVNTVYNAFVGEKKHKHDIVITNFPLPKSYTSKRIIIYLYDKFAWKGRMNFTWTNHMTFTWTVMWVHMTQSLMIKKNNFKFWSQIFDILEKQSIGYCIRLINRTLSVWNMTVKYGEKKNTHETGRLTLRQMFSTAWFKKYFQLTSNTLYIIENLSRNTCTCFSCFVQCDKNKKKQKKTNHQKAVRL